jgi:putative (di)nucleoside polyphosphate hydrolase
MNIDFEKLEYRKSTVALVVNNKAEILIIQKHSYTPDQWDFPGGGIDGNEKAEETILRELKEELGSKKFEIVKVGNELDRYNWSDEYILERFNKYGELYRGQERVRFLVKFLGNDDEIIIEDGEIRKYKWIKISELEKYLVFPGYFEKIKKVLTEFGIDK